MRSPVRVLIVNGRVISTMVNVQDLFLNKPINLRGYYKISVCKLMIEQRIAKCE